jgi:hypothetical protein
VKQEKEKEKEKKEEREKEENINREKRKRRGNTIGRLVDHTSKFFFSEITCHIDY